MSKRSASVGRAIRERDDHMLHLMRPAWQRARPYSPLAMDDGDGSGNDHFANERERRRA